MTLYSALVSAQASDLVPDTDRLRLAVAACLAQFKGASRDHTNSDLRCYLAWCAERSLDPFLAQRPHLELYRICVIDGVLKHSPAEYVRRPAVPAESPTLGFTHLQFEALLTAARQLANPNDFAPVAMLGLLGLRIFEATGADISDLGEEHGHQVLRVRGKGGKVVLVPLPPAVGRAIDRAADHRNSGPGPAQQPRHKDGPACRHAMAPADG
jgi:integrase